MKTKVKIQKQSPKGRENKIVFIEYSSTRKGQHFMTVGDMYKNTHARVYKTYNKEKKRFEYQVKDHEGKLMFEQPFTNQGELKQAFIKNQEQLLEAGHQRRIQALEAKKEVEKTPLKTPEKQQPSPKESNEKDVTDKREAELNELRESKQEQEQDKDAQDIDW